MNVESPFQQSRPIPDLRSAPDPATQAKVKSGLLKLANTPDGEFTPAMHNVGLQTATTTRLNSFNKAARTPSAPASGLLI